MELFPDKFSKRKAAGIQKHLAEKVITTKDFKEITTVTGADVAYANDLAAAAFVTLRLPDLSPVDRICVITRPGISYIPGYLAFREGPPLVDAYSHMATTPELIVFDGHGVSHPAGAGLATHMGIFFNTPSIGCAKEHLCGDYTEPPGRRGSFSRITIEGKPVGAAVRTREGVKPIFVSTGHRIDLETAIEYILFLTPSFRIPEPVRRAHMLAEKSLADYLARKE